jgi:formiminoglutamase
MTNFDGEALWYEPPDDTEIEARRRDYHVPYHEALSVELERIRALHGVAILYDCHSIRSEIPFLFEGILPDFNIGTNIGITCDPAIESAVVGVCHRAEGYTSILNGRFKGGWSTRYHGHPSKGLHAIQMELAQSTHLEMEKPPFSYDLEKAESLRRHLRQVLESVQKIAFDLKEQS